MCDPDPYYTVRPRLPSLRHSHCALFALWLGGLMMDDSELDYGDEGMVKQKPFSPSGEISSLRGEIAARIGKKTFPQRVSQFFSINTRLMNIIYNCRLYVLIMWNIYFISDAVVLAGNTRTAEEKGMASEGSDMADLEVMDRETATEDFYLFGVPAVGIIVVFVGCMIINLLVAVRYETYGSLGYITKYVSTRRSALHKTCCRAAIGVVFLLVVYGFVSSYLEDAPIVRVASPLLLGLYSTMIAAWELYDHNNFSLVCTTKEAAKIPIDYGVTSDISQMMEMVQLGIQAVLLNSDNAVLISLGLTDEDIEVITSGGVTVEMTGAKKGASEGSCMAGGLWFCGY